MTTVQQALHAFQQSIQLTDRQKEDASAQEKRLRAVLSRRLSLAEAPRVSGSFARGTAIRPLNDIDLFVVLQGSTHLEAPGATLRRIQRELDKEWPNKEHPVKQSRSVKIEFSGTGIAYDVVPALRANNGSYRIPDLDRNKWIGTNPGEHKRLATEANKRAGGKLKPLFRCVKHWRACNDELGRSFHLEVLSWGAFHRDPGDWVDGLAALLAHLSNRVTAPCADPARLGPNVDDGIPRNDLNKLQRQLATAAGIAREAAQWSRARRTEHAHFRLRQLFGNAYPEKGRDPAR